MTTPSPNIKCFDISPEGRRVLLSNLCRKINHLLPFIMSMIMQGRSQRLLLKTKESFVLKAFFSGPSCSWSFLFVFVFRQFILPDLSISLPKTIGNFFLLIVYLICFQKTKLIKDYLKL